MSTVQPPVDTTTSGSGSGLVLGVKIASAVLAVGIVVQAALAGNGTYGGERDLIEGHEMLGSLLFIVAVIQVVLAFLGLQKGILSRALMIASVVTLLLIVVQLGLGYSGRDNPDAWAWHLPNGVLLMGFCTYMAVLSWMRPGNRA